MKRFLALFDLASGRPLAREEEGTAHRMQLVVHATLATIVFAMIYGVAAGSTDLGLAVANIYKLPMIILLSALCALPAGLLAWKLLGARNRASDLLIGVAAGNFTAALVLAALSPLVGLYYHTSGYMGGRIAMVAGGFAVLLGLVTVVRAVLSRAGGLPSKASMAIPLAVLVSVELASLVQFIHVASPILPEVTVFDGGVDAMLGS